MNKRFSSTVLALSVLVGGCATTPYSIGAAPGGRGLAHYQSGRPTLIARTRTGVVQVTPIASEFQDRIVLAVSAANLGGKPVNFGAENIGAVFEDGGAANLVSIEALRREAREHGGGGAIAADHYGADATAIVDAYGRQDGLADLAALRTTTLDPQRMTAGLIVLEKPWLNDRVRTLVLNIDLGGEAYEFRLAVARRGVLLPLGGVTATMRFDVAELQAMPQIPLQASAPSARPAAQAARKGPALPAVALAKASSPRSVTTLSSRTPVSASKFDPYARPRLQRGVIE